MVTSRKVGARKVSVPKKKEVIEGYKIQENIAVKASQNKIVYVLIGLLVIGAFFVGTLWTKVKELEKRTTNTTATLPTSVPGQPSLPSNVDVKDVKSQGEPFIGKNDAPVTMAYWRDFQCPFCQRFEQDTLSELVTKYVTTGKLRIIFKDFQFLGPDSQTVGLVARAVWEVAPDKFYDWQKYIFDHQGTENSGWGTKDKLMVMTKAVLGSSQANKVSSLADQKKAEYQKAIDDDKTEGGKFGVTGTPGFVLGNQVIAGAVPTSNFETAIDALLTKK
ncbi:hypothetical protein A3D00_02705 [Candidatus Woesebacteria bacterium RIFCSPHIGHO2_02_FULL_38_9]|uniref:Thioredoxin domain-containing protein n=1 Tax=Candidatus Woesebacteria bacterium RIFCSPHIGHO2_01_FULL_39_28 TaxID=1802496 RepID=A0A1F7YE81_9BACT|nr:MAG: hypothetical protein A2627_04295 [Candidatus Woesebacteria bacterium RIFCSPHIGHO2_01_FULL_39_28]OGM35160.1 MAG: hypothetical protein A3D00_02705 [Candidatus Woesebacteria bacterium RIFCSPHIGHO2_02_FULL_38_9]OGM57750.1 MAG: hypothetical protein A3A50_05555 [Candidatus Woesebacteria bacterium RIFCSPLOWO2_01_FULL_38_20]